MFTGVVVESFSYVFQLVGGAKSITREEMRSFKKIWAEFANPRTGFLEKNRLIPFLGVGYPFSTLLTVSLLDLPETHWGIRSTDIPPRVQCSANFGSYSSE